MEACLNGYYYEWTRAGDLLAELDSVIKLFH